MSNLIIRVLTALLTFIIGVISVNLAVSYLYSDISVKVELNKLPEIPSQPIIFSGGVIVSLLQLHYYSSDGMSLRYGCSEHKSISHTTKLLREEVAGRHVIEHTQKLDNNGKRIGERVILADSDEFGNDTKIVWTEGRRYFSISSASSKHALLFEKSQVWAKSHFCVNVR